VTVAERTAIPRRVGIMADGSRRWASKNGLPTIEGYREGAAHLVRFFSWCDELGIESVTAWLTTERNVLRRPAHEMAGLYEVIGDLAWDVARQRCYRLAVIGSLHLVPAHLAASLTSAAEATVGIDGMEVVLGVACGGRSQILRAVEGCVAERPGEPLTEEAVTAWLARHHQGELDLMIRASGETRLSDMGVWEAAWAELCFSAPLWEDFTRPDLDHALKEFASGSRRFGH
jgi:short-chain Z-isoprenyl diphosphate synthase